MGGADPWLRRRRLTIRGVGLPGTPATRGAAPPAALGAALLLAFLGLLAAPGLAVDGDDLGVVDEAVDQGDDAGGVGEGLAPLREGPVGGDYVEFCWLRLETILNSRSAWRLL